MPLSEHEQRLFEQIERSLAEDPKFASAVRSTDPRFHARRRIILAAIAVVLGLAVLVFGVAEQEPSAGRRRVRGHARCGRPGHPGVSSGPPPGAAGRRWHERPPAGREARWSGRPALGPLAQPPGGRRRLNQAGTGHQGWRGCATPLLWPVVWWIGPALWRARSTTQAADPHALLPQTQHALRHAEPGARPPGDWASAGTGHFPGSSPLTRAGGGTSGDRAHSTRAGEGTSGDRSSHPRPHGRDHSVRRIGLAGERADPQRKRCR